ncbi:YdeI/OmpD-associated family protein [Paenibacillus wynnii]|uniref:DUF1905 domain-containing protein n=1 Tax=Paenibacillus wynnii TaxID=268407 RepID=A0A098MFE9_9BACL|nr:YdeI/OmpD-associated family protein [Paenibacillus wynnii]KGE20267.1 hypothetical protein PWYN_13690 [Paenibacillus wynnii]
MAETFSTNIMKVHNKNATGIPVPAEVITSLSGSKKPSVKVSFNGYTYRSTVAVMGGEFLIPLSQSNREAAGVEPGDAVEVTLELDLEPRTVEIPDDLRVALSAQEGALEAFGALAPSKSKECIRQVNDAKTPETRNRRISAILAALLK